MVLVTLLLLYSSQALITSRKSILTESRKCQSFQFSLYLSLCFSQVSQYSTHAELSVQDHVQFRERDLDLAQKYFTMLYVNEEVGTYVPTSSLT